MSTQISNQASKVWTILTDSETATIYGKAGGLTWSIIREIGLLLWLVVCLTLVLFDWFWKTSIRLGQNTRNWLDNFEKPTTDRLASETGKTLMSALSSGAAYALTQAREQLGMPQPVEDPTTMPKLPPASNTTPSDGSVVPEPTSVTPALPKNDENEIPGEDSEAAAKAETGSNAVATADGDMVPPAQETTKAIASEDGSDVPSDTLETSEETEVERLL